MLVLPRVRCGLPTWPLAARDPPLHPRRCSLALQQTRPWTEPPGRQKAATWQLLRGAQTLLVVPLVPLWLLLQPLQLLQPLPPLLLPVRPEEMLKQPQRHHQDERVVRLPSVVLIQQLQMMVHAQR